MKHITYTTEKKINALKKNDAWDRTNEENLVIQVWDKIFSDCSYYGATLKEFENYLGHKLDNNRQTQVYYYTGIHGLEYKTNGNVRYVGTNDLSYINIADFNKWVKSL